jgi:hypothetical protein
MNNDNIIALIIAALVGLIPNIILKLLDKQKPKEDMIKTTIEAADLSMDMMKASMANEEKQKELCLIKLEKANKKLNELYAIIFTIMNSKEVVIPDELKKELLECLNTKEGG